MTPMGSYGFLCVPIDSTDGAISDHYDDDDDDRYDDVDDGDDDHVVGDDEPEKYVEVTLPVVRVDPQCGAQEDLAVQASSVVPQRVVRPEGQPQLQQPRGAGECAAPLWLPAVSHLPPPAVSSVDVAAVVAAPAVVDLTGEFCSSPSASVRRSSRTDDGVGAAAQFASK